MTQTKVPFWPAALALVASGLGLAFALSSTIDYTHHLDRQVHDLHCSFIPGVAGEAGQEAACRAAMYSPYSALFKDRYWGGIPVSLPAVGAFAFFAAFAIYLLLARERAPRRAHQFLFLAGLTPLAVSGLMFFISLTKLGQFCKTCVGIYSSSALLAVAGIGALLVDRKRAREALAAFRSTPGKTVFSPPAAAAVELEKAEKKAEGVAPTLVEGEVPAVEPPGDPDAPFTPPRTGGPGLIPAWLFALAVFSVVPALLYVSAMPAYSTYVTGCGKLENPADPTKALLHVTPPGAKQQATMVVDPLCPTCKAFHQRLVTEGLFDQLDTTLVLFPLDNECNWMLDRPLHPGACVVAKAILCGDHRALSMLEWSYENQDDLVAAAKGSEGIAKVRSMIRDKWSGLDTCIDSKETKQRLERVLRWTIQNQLTVSTPQLFLDGVRLCEEDSDIGLSYSITRLAPNLARSR
ncbi:MAG: vitamin K epoxide reductase family protein [Polyangiaceae bacterium]